MASGRTGFFGEVFAEFGRDEAAMRAAGVAFYAALSLAPMVLLFVAITGLLGDSVQRDMIDTVTRAVGEQAGRAIETIAAEGSGRVDKAGWSLAISIAVILFSASGVVAALQVGLNRVWGVKASREAGWKRWLRTRVLSMAMVLGIGFLLLVSMVATTVVGMVVPGGGWLWNLVTFAVSLAVFVVLFAAMFKVLPDVRIGWKDVWTGAGITALLFSVGQYLIGLYIANAGYSSSYGAAGSLVAMLVWVYFSAVIIFLGAEVTQVWARRKGTSIMPDRHAVRVREVEETGRVHRAA